MINIKGKEYPFKFTVGACRDYKEQIGKDITELQGESIPFDSLIAIVVFGIKWGFIDEDKEPPKIQELDNKVGLLSIEELTKAVEKAMESIGGKE